MKQIKKVLSTRSFNIERAIQSTEAANEITVIFSTGHKGLRSDWIENFYEELEMSEVACDLTRLKKGAPFLSQHTNDVREALGVVREAWIKDGVGYAKIQLSEREEFAGIIKDINSGILNNVSVGYTVENYEDISEKNASIRTYLATKWTPVEISLVAVGFDPNAQVTRQNEQKNEVTINVKEYEMKFSEMSEEQKRAHIQTKMDAKTDLETEERSFYDENMKEKTPEVTKIDVEEVQRQIKVELKKRTASITTAVRASGLDMKLAEEFIDSDMTVEQVSTRIFETLEQNKNEKLKTEKETRTMDKLQQMQEAILNRVNAVKFKVDRENPYKQATLMEIAKELVPQQTGENPQAYAQRAIQTSDLVNLLSNIANKVLDEKDGQEIYNFTKIAVEQPLRDMKATPIIQVGNSGLAEKSPETGEYTEGTMSDSKETITLQDRGVIFKMTYKAIINDDLGVLKQIGTKAPEMGAKDLEKLVIGVINTNAVLNDGLALFHATHGNVITGGTLPTEAQLDAANQLMRAFKDQSNEPMDLSGKYLLVPPKFEVAAKKLVAQITAASSANVNPFSGTMEVLVSSRLAQVATKDAWYLICNPSECAPLVYGTLEGQGAKPEVAVEEDFNSKGLKVRVTQPGAAAAATSKGIVRIVLV